MRIQCEHLRGVYVAVFALAAVVCFSLQFVQASLGAGEVATGKAALSPPSVIYLHQGVPHSLSAEARTSELFPALADTPVTDFDAAGGIIVASRAGALIVVEPNLPPRSVDLRSELGNDFYASLVRLSPDGASALVGGYNAGGEPPGFRLARVDTSTSAVNLVKLTKHQSPLLLENIRYSPDGTAYVLLVDESLPASKLFALQGDTLRKVWDSTKVLEVTGEPSSAGSKSGWLSIALADYFPRAETLILVVYVIAEEETGLAQRAEAWTFDPAASRTTHRFILPNPNPDRYFNTSFAIAGSALFFVRLGGLAQDESKEEPVLSATLHRLDLTTGSAVELMSLSIDNAPESPFYRVALFPGLSALAIIHGGEGGFRAHLLNYSGLELLPGSSMPEMESDRLVLISGQW